MENGRKYSLMITFVTTFLFFFISLTEPLPFLKDSPTNEFVKVDKRKLEHIASEKIKTLHNSPLVITGANYEYVSTEMLPNFLCSIQETAPTVLEHLLVFALDSNTKYFLSKRFPEINTFSSKKYWDIDQELLRSTAHTTTSYHFFLMKKALFLEKTLKYSHLDMIWTDSDLVWLEDVREWFINLPKKGCDIMFSDDKRNGDNNTNSSSPNAGLYYARNTPSTRKLFRLWSADLWNRWQNHVVAKEQTSLKRSILKLNQYYPVSRRHWGNYPQTTSPDNFTICFLPQDKFPHFSRHLEEGRIENVAIVHPNIGHKEKKDRILRNGFWFWDSEKGCVERFNETLVKLREEEKREKTFLETFFGS